MRPVGLGSGRVRRRMLRTCAEEFPGLSEMASHVDQLDVQVLRRADEPAEGGLVVDLLALHQDALALADEVTGADRPMAVSRSPCSHSE
jgi:hypothetical protein